MKKLTLLVFLAAGCGSDANNPPIDGAPIDSPTATCFSGTPQTHLDLINACVDQSVTVIIKHPTLPLLNPDGTLPPLP